MGKSTMSVRELSTALGVSLPIAYALTEQSGFPVVRIGRRKVVPVQAFENWLSAHAAPQTTPAAGIRRVEQ